MYIYEVFRNFLQLYTTYVHFIRIQFFHSVWTYIQAIKDRINSKIFSSSSCCDRRPRIYSIKSASGARSDLLAAPVDLHLSRAVPHHLYTSGIPTCRHASAIHALLLQATIYTILSLSLSRARPGSSFYLICANSFELST